MLDRAAIESMLSEMDRHVSLLESLGPIPKEEFLRDPKIHLLAERCFQLAIQCLLDICYHLAARRGWERPEDGSAAIACLSQHGVFPQEFAHRIRPMANFRNILVHAYLSIDRELVHANLARLDDFRAFQRYVLVALASP